MHASASWRAQVGHQVTDRTYDSSSKTWEDAYAHRLALGVGPRGRVFDDLLVPGSDKLSSHLLRKIQDYDTQALVPTRLRIWRVSSHRHTTCRSNRRGRWHVSRCATVRVGDMSRAGVDLTGT